VTNRAAFEDSTIQEFLRQIAPVRSELDLNNLKDNRESGDYDLYSGIDRAVAENAVREAREFLTEVERYLQPLLS